MTGRLIAYSIPTIPVKNVSIFAYNFEFWREIHRHFQEKCTFQFSFPPLSKPFVNIQHDHAKKTIHTICAAVSICVAASLVRWYVTAFCRLLPIPQNACPTNSMSIVDHAAILIFRLFSLFRSLILIV